VFVSRNIETQRPRPGFCYLFSEDPSQSHADDCYFDVMADQVWFESLRRRGCR
jgi:hypothetical protein